jgi:hypoxanthine phosphoribosyltransferase
MMQERIERVLLDQMQITERISEMGKEISQDYQGKELLLIGVLKGAFIFLADLVRAIDLPIALDFVAVSSYGHSTETTGVVRIIKDVDYPVTGKHILLVEDIVDSGLTLKYLAQVLAEQKPASLKLCALLDKPERRKVSLDVDYIGFSIPNEFVVGYGLDYNGKYRNLPFVGTITQVVDSKAER